jgi:ElaB/YqjD/DUF883 family membrane-anchored ribosome-binding protein
MSADPQLAAAGAQVQAARARFFTTLAEVQERLKPSTIAQDAVETVSHGVASAARAGADAVRARPLAAGAIAATVGLVLARGWIASIFRRRRDETPAPPRGSTTDRALRDVREDRERIAR